MKLRKVERAALLKCRYAGRYDNLRDPSRKRGTPEEYAEEAAASRVLTPLPVLVGLSQRGLLTEGPRFRLTDAGKAVLCT